jgi:hypothetical protein
LADISTGIGDDSQVIRHDFWRNHQGLAISAKSTNTTISSC